MLLSSHASSSATPYIERTTAAPALMQNDQSQTLTAAEIDKDNPASTQAAHQASPLAAINSTKRFSASSVNVNKRFLNKAAPATSPNLVPKQPIAVAVQKPASPASRVKLLTGKRNPTSPSLSHKQLSDSTKDSAGQSEGIHGVQSGHVEEESGRNAAAANKVWGARPTQLAASVGGKTSQIGIKDFPTAAEAARGPPPPINYNEAIDSAFAGLRSKHDTHNTGWDEMMDDSLDFSSDVLEFGDGIQYKVSSHAEQPIDAVKASEEHAEVPVSKEERFPQNYDRSWRPPTSPKADGPSRNEESFNRKVIYDDRRDKFNSVPQASFEKPKVRDAIPRKEGHHATSTEVVRLLHKEPTPSNEAETHTKRMDSNGPYPASNTTSPTTGEQPPIPQTHDAQRQAMLEAAERARKRRQEEEAARQQEAERARLKASLLAGVGGEKSSKTSTSPPTVGGEGAHSVSTPPPNVAAASPELMRRPHAIPGTVEPSAVTTPILSHRVAGPSPSITQVITEKPGNVTNPAPKTSPTTSYRPSASRSLDYVLDETMHPSYPIDVAHSRPLLSPALPLSPRAVHVKLPRKADAKQADHSSFDDVMSRIKGALGDGFAAQARTHDDGTKMKEVPEEAPIQVKLGPTVGSIPEQSELLNEHSATTKSTVNTGMSANKTEHLIFVPVRHSAESDRLQIFSTSLFEVLRSFKTPVRIPRLRKKSHGRTFQSRFSGMESTWVDKMFGRLPFAPISREELSEFRGNGTTVKLPTGKPIPEQPNNSAHHHPSNKKYDRNNAARRGHHKAAFSQRGHSKHANNWRAGSVLAKDKAVAVAAPSKDSS